MLWLLASLIFRHKSNLHTAKLIQAVRDLFGKFAFVKDSFNIADVASSREHCLSHVRLLLAIFALELCHRFKASDSVSWQQENICRFVFSDLLAMTTTMMWM